jgi:hypothetical protein
MAIIDANGRIFGKVSILDIGAALIILMVLAGIFLFPGTSGSVAQIGVTTRPVEVDLIVRGLTVAQPQALVDEIREQGKMNIIIRNQPAGSVGVKEVRELPRSVAVPQPDGSVTAFPDPRPELGFTLDMLITLADDAQITDGGPVFGNNKVKIGGQVEVEGLTYRFNTSVVGVRILDDA